MGLLWYLILPTSHKAVQTSPVEKGTWPQVCDPRFLPPHLEAWPFTGSKEGEVA